MAGAEVNVIDSVYEHALELAPRMRAEDAAEVMAAKGQEPLDAIGECFHLSRPPLGMCRTLMIGADVAAMWGVSTREAPPDVGFIWMLGTELVPRYRKSFLRVCSTELERMLAFRPVLMNTVDCRYSAAVRWLKWLGAEMAPPQSYGTGGEPFMWFNFRKEAANGCNSGRSRRRHGDAGPRPDERRGRRERVSEGERGAA